MPVSVETLSPVGPRKQGQSAPALRVGVGAAALGFSSWTAGAAPQPTIKKTPNHAPRCIKPPSHRSKPLGLSYPNPRGGKTRVRCSKRAGMVLQEMTTILFHESEEI